MKNYSLEEIKKDCSELELKILYLYLNRVKQKDICMQLSIKRFNIDRLVAKYNLNRFRDRKNYCCNSINIKDPKFWYFLGLFASDGNLYKSGTTDIIQFTLDDYEALEDIKNILQYTGKIQQYKKLNKIRYYLKISDSELINTVRKVFKNDCYRKTNNLKFPEIEDKECLIMFLRGFIDGDGSFAKCKNPLYYRIKLYCASADFFESFCDKISNITNSFTIYNNLYLEISSQKSVYKVLKYLYSIFPEIGVKRKKERALQHIKNYELKI